MADKVTSTSPAPINRETEIVPAKKSPKTAKKAQMKATHPRTAKMVTTAIAVLNESSGSSLRAIKKYVANTYKVDPERQAAFIKKFLKSSVISGSLVQTKGKGAAGSFKLSIKSDAGRTEIRAAKFTVERKNVPKKTSQLKKVSAIKGVSKKTGNKNPTIKNLAASQAKAKIAKIGKVKTSVVSLPKRSETKKRLGLTKIRKPVPKKVIAMKK